MESVPLTANGVKISALQRWGAVALAALSVLLIDQLSKAWALRRLSTGEIVDVMFSLRFNLAFNTGMAFSKGAGMGPLIGIVAIVIAGVLLVMARKSTSILQLIFIGIVIGGAVGNVVDRLSRVGEAPNFTSTGFMSGAVVDFVDLQWWPIFNVADASIVLGGLGLALIGARPRVSEQEADSASDSGSTAGTTSDTNAATSSEAGSGTADA